MATLTGQQINNTYEGLIKTANNAAGAPFPPVSLQYGDGTDLPIKIGDGTGVGVGDIVTLVSGTKSVDVNANGVGITGITSMDAAAGTPVFVNGTFQFGAPAPVPATSVDFTNSTVTGGEISNDSATNTSIFKIWSGTEAQYNALGSYDANTLYYLT